MLMVREGIAKGGPGVARPVFVIDILAAGPPPLPLDLLLHSLEKLTESHVVVVYQGLIVTLDKHRKLGELGFTLYESTKLLY